MAINKTHLVIAALAVVAVGASWYAYNLKNKLDNQTDSLDVLRQEAAARGVDLTKLGFR